MRILVLTTEELKGELMMLPVSGELRLQWAGPEEYPREKDLKDLDACVDLVFNNTPGRIAWLKGLNCRLIVVNSVITTLAEIGEEFIRINGWHGFLKRPVIEAASANPVSMKKTEELFALLGRSTEWVPDIAGFITARIVSSIINEAFFALEEGVSTEAEIDTAMTLGTNYPFGPFEWSQRIGLKNVHLLLKTLEREQSRYLPSSLLTRRALA